MANIQSYAVNITQEGFKFFEYGFKHISYLIPKACTSALIKLWWVSDVFQLND